MKAFFKKSTDESMKRLCGFIGYIAASIVICIFQQQYIRELLYCSATLIAGGIADTLISKIK